MLERVQKIIAAAGIASRRSAEALILEGRVRVNGKVVTEMGCKADPGRDHIKVDGKLINPLQQKVYLMLNKPEGYVTTAADPEGRKTVMELVGKVRERVYPVGRLDYNTEGLLLLTNDGDFAHLVMHPSHELPKTYLAKIKGSLSDGETAMLEQGVFLRDGKTAPARIRRLRKEEVNSWIEITIHEGRKRQVRRMFDHVDHSVIRLRRIRVGNLSLGDLSVGSFRHLSADEVESLRTMAQAPRPPVPAVADVPARRPGPDWKRMEVEAIPGPTVRSRKVAADRGAGERGGGRERESGKKSYRRPDAGGRSWGNRIQKSDRGARRAAMGPERREPGREAGRPGIPGSGPARRPSVGRSRRPEAGHGPFVSQRTSSVRGAQRPFMKKGPRQAGGPGLSAGRGNQPREDFRGTRPLSREGGEGSRTRFTGDRRRPTGALPLPRPAVRSGPFTSDSRSSVRGTQRPFIQKGPRPAGGPGGVRKRGSDRRSAFSEQRPVSRDGWEGRRTGVPTDRRRPTGALPPSRQGQRTWHGPGRTGHPQRQPTGTGRGPFRGASSRQGGPGAADARSGAGGPRKGRRPNSRGPRRS